MNKWIRLESGRIVKSDNFKSGEPMNYTKPKSDYDYTIKEDGSVHIVDLNLGRMSVTNDAEQVLMEIHHHIDLTGRHVTYRDSDGQVDSLIHEKGVFIRFAPG